MSNTSNDAALKRWTKFVAKPVVIAKNEETGETFRVWLRMEDGAFVSTYQKKQAEAMLKHGVTEEWATLGDHEVDGKVVPGTNPKLYVQIDEEATLATWDALVTRVEDGWTWEELRGIDDVLAILLREVVRKPREEKAKVAFDRIAALGGGLPSPANGPASAAVAEPGEGAKP